MKRFVVALLLSGIALAARKQGSPLEHLPKDTEVLTHFGERADFSPDNQRIAFMSKSFGDAFVIDLKTREWATYHRQVSPWEVEQYLTAF